MATMRDIVTGAAKKIHLIDPRKALDAEDAQDILTILNEMITGWEADGVNVLLSSDLKLGGTFPLDDKHREGVKAMLAVKIAPDFEMPVPPLVFDEAETGWNRIWADYAIPDTMKVDRALRRMPSQRKFFR